MKRAIVAFLAGALSVITAQAIAHDPSECPPCPEPTPSPEATPEVEPKPELSQAMEAAKRVLEQTQAPAE